MKNRRSFIAGMLAAGVCPRLSWADVGDPAFLSAGKKPDGTFVLCGLSAAGQIAFELPLPARGHAAAAHPSRPEAVAFARRPGRFAVVLNCASGHEIARLSAPKGRHFYGHGAYSSDGSLLFTTENDYEAARGIVGIWDVTKGYRRTGEFWSGGVGPHDIKRMPGGDRLVVANGGIETHPETGRVKLNIPTMRSNLTYLNQQGDLLGQMRLEDSHQKNSIRHLAVSQTGHVAFAMQWQGDTAHDLPLLGTHAFDELTTSFAQGASVRRLNGYVGSVAISRDGRHIAITSPRRGVMQVFQDLQLTTVIDLPDVCGVAPSKTGFFVTTGKGRSGEALGAHNLHPVVWDNHLVPV